MGESTDRFLKSSLGKNADATSKKNLERRNVNYPNNKKMSPNNYFPNHYFSSSAGQFDMNDTIATTKFSGETYMNETRRRMNIDPITDNTALNYQNFDRWYSVYPDWEMKDLKSYVFITRPDCNILSDINPRRETSDTCKNDPFMRNMVADYNIVCRNLTKTLSYEHDFMTFTVGRTESLQIPDLAIKNSTIDQPYTNYRMPFAGTTIESQTGGTFDIVFREDERLRFHKLFQIWLYYMNGVKRNIFQPFQHYIESGKYDYMCSVYYLVCLPDAQTIIWWGKYTGAFPLNVPNSDFSFNLGGQMENKVNISFAYFLFESLEPAILTDFNLNSANVPKDKYVPSYDPWTLSTGAGLVGPPFIVFDPSAKLQPILRWSLPINAS